jgi:hypothetical protein
MRNLSLRMKMLLYVRGCEVLALFIWVALCVGFVFSENPTLSKVFAIMLIVVLEPVVAVIKELEKSRKNWEQAHLRTLTYTYVCGLCNTATWGTEIYPDDAPLEVIRCARKALAERMRSKHLSYCPAVFCPPVTSPAFQMVHEVPDPSEGQARVFSPHEIRWTSFYAN